MSKDFFTMHIFSNFFKKMLNFNMIFIKEGFCLTTINQNRNSPITFSPPIINIIEMERVIL